jgi:hypothetical protein
VTTILRNTNLDTGKNPIQGWETCAASAGDVVMYTGNWMAAYSVDGGATFSAIDVGAVCKRKGQDFVSDQIVIYVPSIDNFCWIIQTIQGNYVLAVATPDEIKGSHGTFWWSWLIPAANFGVPGGVFDYPELAVGNSYLYLTCNISSSSIALRLSLTDLRSRGYLHFLYLSFPVLWPRPVHSCLETGYIVMQNSASSLRVYSWPETSQDSTYFDVDLAWTIPTLNFPVSTPGGDVWLGPTSKVDWHLYSATRTGSRIWVAWNGGRRIQGQSKDSFNFPHIGLAVIDIQSRKLVNQTAIANGGFGFAWPALATNAAGDVGLSFCWGGNQLYPQHGVGMLTGPGKGLVATTSGPSAGAGGHYVSLRPRFPDTSTFCAAGFNQPKGKDGSVKSDPHYIVFKA